MKIIKTENRIFDGKIYTIKFWQESAELFAQAFQGLVPVSHQFTVDTAQIDAMRRYYRFEPIDMLKNRVKGFVEECTRLKIKGFMLR